MASTDWTSVDARIPTTSGSCCARAFNLYGSVPSSTLPTLTALTSTRSDRGALPSLRMPAGAPLTCLLTAVD